MTNSPNNVSLPATVPHLAIVGYSNSGKTTLLVRLIAGLKEAGYRLGVLKHDGHDDIEMDHPGTDTFQFGEAGADCVMIASSRTVNLTEHLSEPPVLQDLLRRLEQAVPLPDLFLIEGFKNEPTPKILVARTPEGLSLLDRLTGVLAVVTDLPVAAESLHPDQPDLPVFHPNETEAIQAFITEWLRQIRFPIGD